ncbi:MAG TPA: RsmB/NOP family class I SAM-dependent RNA methyltransferase [Azospira sp.]|nr:RsmB/NOP family class I SAM-dependent RNA methyltransferase [Azospira sp.]
MTTARSPRISPALFAHAEAALEAVLRLDYPADAVVSRYFREHRELGHRDRGFVAEVVFAVLRRKRSLEYLARPSGAPRLLLLAALACIQGANLRELQGLAAEEDLEWLAAAKGEWAAMHKGAATEGAASEVPPAVRRDLPDWLHERLLAQMGEAELDALVTAINQSAPLDLRINPVKANREAVQARLAADGIVAAPTPYSPLGLRLKDKPALSRHPLFLDGSIEVQDEGSQLLGLLVAPKRGEMVADFCAGAGGKTLLLGALMRSQGRLYAFDVSEKRLANLKPRLARSGLSNVHPVRIEHEADTKVKRLAGKMDRVLVDAPCSGLGTLRRNPDLKWRQDEASVAELVQKQTSILAAAARLVRPGGRLVYATCSLLREENDGVADAFLAAHPEFVAVSAATVLEKQDVVVPGVGERLALQPQHHGSDAFFAAVFERKAP